MGMFYKLFMVCPYYILNLKKNNSISDHKLFLLTKLKNNCITLFNYIFYISFKGPILSFEKILSSIDIIYCKNIYKKFFYNLNLILILLKIQGIYFFLLIQPINLITGKRYLRIDLYYKGDHFS